MHETAIVLGTLTSIPLALVATILIIAPLVIGYKAIRKAFVGK